MPAQARSVLPGGCTKGELTVPGQLQSRDLGKWLRQRYVKELAYLSPQYQVQDTLALANKLLCSLTMSLSSAGLLISSLLLVVDPTL